jgi:hypothetical protein
MSSAIAIDNSPNIRKIKALPIHFKVLASLKISFVKTINMKNTKIGITEKNPKLSPRYLKILDKSAPTTVGTKTLT